MKVEDIVNDMEKFIESNASNYLLWDLTDLEEQRDLLAESTGNDDSDWLEMLMDQKPIQDSFAYLQDRLNTLRNRVLQSYAELCEFEKQFRRDVL